MIHTVQNRLRKTYLEYIAIFIHKGNTFGQSGYFLKCYKKFSILMTNIDII